MAGLHKMMNTREIALYHQVDKGGECWLLDGVGKRRGMKAGLQNVGWTWLRGPDGGVWETKDTHQVELCVARGLKIIESATNEANS